MVQMLFLHLRYRFGDRGEWKPKTLKPWIPDLKEDSRANYRFIREIVDRKATFHLNI